MPLSSDRRLERLVRLTGAANNSMLYNTCLVNGNMLAWQSYPHEGGVITPDNPRPSEESLIHILNTAKLP